MTPPIRVVFLGSPEFAVPSLRELTEHAGIDVVLVVTQPDRPVGRGRNVQPPPVKTFADSRGLAVFQPSSLRDPEAVARLVAVEPDVLVVVSYGEILRRDVLELAPHGCLNVHPSLLPSYRGATPIPAAILNGDDETGVSIIRLVRRMDAGPIVFQKRVPLTGSETTGFLNELLAGEAASVLPQVVIDWVDGSRDAQPQDETRATYTRELRKSDGQIDWRADAVQIERHVRAMDPWPRAWTLLDGQRLAVHTSTVADRGGQHGAPGSISTVERGVFVATGEGLIELNTVQPAGKKPMLATDWARGARLSTGSRFALPEEPVSPFIETR